MLNKVLKNFQKQEKETESFRLRKELEDAVNKQGGYTEKQKSLLIDLQQEYRDDLERIRIESLKKNLLLLNQ